MTTSSKLGSNFCDEYENSSTPNLVILDLHLEYYDSNINLVDSHWYNIWLHVWSLLPG